MLAGVPGRCRQVRLAGVPGRCSWQVFLAGVGRCAWQVFLAGVGSMCVLKVSYFLLMHLGLPWISLSIFQFNKLQHKFDS